MQILNCLVAAYFIDGYVRLPFIYHFPFIFHRTQQIRSHHSAIVCHCIIKRCRLQRSHFNVITKSHPRQCIRTPIFRTWLVNNRPTFSSNINPCQRIQMQPYQMINETPRIMSIRSISHLCQTHITTQFKSFFCRNNIFPLFMTLCVYYSLTIY